MKIKDRRRIIMLLPILFGICILTVQQWTAQRVSNALHVEEFTEKVVMDSYALHRLISDMRLYPDELRPRAQWRSTMRYLHELLRKNSISGREQGEIFSKIKKTYHRLDQLYEKFCPECADNGPLLTRLDQRQHRALEQMVVTIHSIESDALQLARLSNIRVEAIRAEEERIIRWAVLLLVIFLSTMVYFVSERLIGHITALKIGSARFGSGELDHRFDFPGNDELADLARSFDRMADQLQQGFTAQKELNSQLKTLNHELQQKTVRLLESEDKFRSISDSAQDAIVLLDAAGDIQYWNGAAERSFGYPWNEAVGKNLHQLIVPKQYHQAHAAGWRHFTETGEGAVIGNTLELSALRRDGTEFPVELSISSFSRQGEWLAVGLIRNISERKESERLINENNIQIRQAHREWMEAFDSVQDPIFLHDGEGRIMRANRAYAEQAGLPVQELIGRPYWECFPKREGPLSACSRVRNTHDVDEFNDEFTIEDGDSYLSRGFAIRDEEGAYRYSVHILKNTTFERQAKQALQESEVRFRKLFERAPLPYQSLDPQGEIIEVNQAWERLLGYEREEVLNKPFSHLLTEPYRSRFTETLATIHKAEDNHGIELMVARKDGELRRVSLEGRISYNTDGELEQSHFILTDITEQHRMMKAIRESEERFRSIYDNALDGILLANSETKRFSTGNRILCQMLGYTLDELKQLSVSDVHPADKLDYVLEQFDRQARGELTLAEEIPVVRKDGSIFYSDINASPFTLNGETYLMGIFRDITERKHSEESLHLKDQVFESSLSAISTSDINGVLTTVNHAFVKLWGYETNEEVLGKTIPEFLFSEDEAIGILNGLNTEGKWEGEYTAKRKDGSTFVAYAVATPLSDAAGTITGYQSSVLDITERKENAKHLFSLNQMLQTSRDCNEALVRATEEEALIQKICDILAAHGDFSLVWAGLSAPEGGMGHTTTATSSDSHAAIEKLTALNAHWQDEDGPCPAREAIKSGQIQVIHDFDSEATYSSYRHKIMGLGCLSLAALPLQNQGKSLGVLMVYSDQSGVFDQQQSELLEELSNDLAYGIKTLRVHQERELMGEQIERILLQTVEAISHTLEIRDPYTAGHQRRVTEFSIAIAEEMGLDEQQVEGIRFGATIHDIGKIHIPAEILNRPGRLTEMEFGIIKSHAQVGYDIIKDVDFPWPVADIIHQHHERLDGSGYPDGLKGDEIIIEARIIAVADVVEAISAHRPYRPGLGIEVALEEIEKNRGTFYDPQVVDTCIDLIKSKRFTFSDIVH